MSQINMRFVSQVWLLSSTMLLVLLITLYSNSSQKTKNTIKSQTFVSPKIETRPGSVVNKFYYNVEFPKGHIALKSFNVEVIDEAGSLIPLQETYLHHWVLIKYHKPKPQHAHHHHQQRIYLRRNSGLCQGDLQGQYFGLGSETGGTHLQIPDPFGVEVGNPEEIPDGYEEAWTLNVHAIDTRGVEDKIGCIECRCDLYNVTQDESNYSGGLKCCHDNTQCRLKKGFEGPHRKFYLRYTVEWVDWDDSVVPLKVYVFDVTDTLQMSNNSNGIMTPTHNCRNEYDVEACNTSYEDGSGCVDVKRTSLPMEFGGYVIYGVAHQHYGAMGSTLYGQDGRVMCSSIPRYGEGKDEEDEEGYVVAMSTCYPEPGSVKIIDGEILTLESNYSNTRSHTGVMGLFYLLVAYKLPPQHS